MRARAVRNLAGRSMCLVAVILAAFTILVGLAACGPSRTVADGPRLSFEKNEYALGQISSSQKAEYRFAFTNTGVRPLEISEIRPEPASPGG